MGLISCGSILNWANRALSPGCVFGNSHSTNPKRVFRTSVVAGMHSSKAIERQGQCIVMNRRILINIGVGLLCLHSGSAFVEAAGLPPEDKLKLCDESCEKELENVPMVTSPSGLQYKDIKVGRGPSPPVGFQVAANYVAMVPSGQIFDSSLEKGQPYIFRVGSGQVIKGLDEGVLSMKVGGPLHPRTTGISERIDISSGKATHTS